MKDLHRWAVVWSILLLLGGLFSAGQLAGAEDMVSARVFDDIFGSHSAGEQADTATLVGFWLALLEDPEFIQKLTAGVENPELEKKLEEIMEKAELEPIMESIMLAVFQKPGVQQTLMALQTEQRIAQRLEAGMQNLNLAMMPAIMKNIAGSDEFISSLVNVGNLVETESLFSRVREKLEGDPEVAGAMQRLDESGVSAETAALRISVKVKPEQEMKRLKNLMMGLMESEEIVKANNQYFLTLLSDRDNRAAIRKFIRDFFGSPATRPIWVEVFATGIQKPHGAEAEFRRQMDRLFQVRFIREGFNSAFAHILQDQAYWAKFNDFVDGYMTAGPGYDFFRDFLIRCLEAAASGG